TPPPPLPSTTLFRPPSASDPLSSSPHYPESSVPINSNGNEADDTVGEADIASSFTFEGPSPEVDTFSIANLGYSESYWELDESRSEEHTSELQSREN